MAQASGEYWQRKPLSSFQNSLQLTWAQALLLVGSGVLVEALHQWLRLPLGLPGRHGIEWMAILILGRSLSRLPYASSLAGAGAAGCSLLAVWRMADDPYLWLIYLLPSILMDFAFARWPAWQQKWWFLIALGGMAHVTKPLARWGINLISGFPYGSFLYGVAYPLLTHILFGMIGSFLAVTLLFGLRRGSRLRI